MTIESTAPESGAPATTTDAQVVDASQQGNPPEGSATPVTVDEDALILSAIRGEEPPKPEGEEGGEPKPKDGATADASKPVDGQAKPEEKGGTPPAKDAATDDAILDDETPKDYKGRTREQFEKLKERGNHYRQEAQTLQARLTEMAPAIEREANFTRLLVDSEGTPEDVGTAISLIRAINKGTIEEKRNGLAVVNALRGILADQLGEALPDVDYLAGHADLQKRVQEGDLAPEDAKEIALSRRTTKVATETASQAEERRRRADDDKRATQAAETARTEAGNAVAAEATRYLQRDGQEVYNIRVAYATQAAKRIGAHTPIPADKVLATFQELYNSDEAQLLVDAATVKTRQATTGGVRPVMGAGRSGGGQAVREAQTEDEAILMAIRGG